MFGFGARFGAGTVGCEFLVVSRACQATQELQLAPGLG